MNETVQTKLSYWFCHQCDRNLKHGEFRFNCVICDNYDVCEVCFATLDPPHPHRMMRELAYGKEEKVEECENINMANGIQRTITMYRDRHCFGVRDVDSKNHSQYTDTYSWLTFETVGNRSRNFGQGLKKIISTGDFLGICSGNRPEWIITDFACVFQGIISVTMYCLFNECELTYIINNTKISVIVCDQQMLPKFIRLSTCCPSLHHIVCMDPISETLPDQGKDNLRIHYMNDIETFGSTQHYEFVLVDPHDCLTIIYTSGSSGFPKGAMISHHAYQIAFLQQCLQFRLDPIYFCYEPLAWITGRSAIFRTFFAGGRTGFSTGHIALLIEDLALVRPTSFSATPAIWNKIYAEYQATLSLAAASEEDRVLEQFSQLIPRRCKRINVGGAMSSSVVLNFIKRCFSHCCIYESYGTTECGAIASNNILKDTLQFRLISIPEMGYMTEDQLFPRGEVVIKTNEMFSGYINNPEETQAAFTDDGFFRTGDIVELRTLVNGEFYVNVIDRKKNFFKLSNGQYISPEFLQTIYFQSPFIEQIYIHGDIFADSIVAVVVPNREYAQVFASEHHWEIFNFNNPHPQFYDAILQNLCSIAKKESLREHEIPSRLIIDFEPFTPENGLLTSSMKPCRHKLAAHYGDQLKSSSALEQRLKTIIETTTKQALVNKKDEHFFIPTGGDSLTAIRLCHMIEHDLGISVPISILLQPDITIQKLLTVMENPSQIFSISHPTIETLLSDSELQLDITVGQRKNTSTSPKLIFITGTTGFIGAFLLAELLSVYPRECKFVCLVRHQSSMNSLDRIRENLLFYKIWKQDFQERIIPLQGDLEKTFFGLDDETYNFFAQQIDIIFHCGANVNFLLPYSKLYRSNVFGTQEIIRLATHTIVCIPIHYISTLSVLSSNVNKEVSIEEIAPDNLISGYAQSKWVAEQLMNKDNSLGLPVMIYRLGSTCASTETGACNRNDLHTFLFAAMMELNSFPETMIHTHLHALPVDFSAKSIVYLSVNQSITNENIHHVFNPQTVVLFEDIIIGIYQCGIILKSISLEEWQSKLKTINDRKSPFVSISELLKGNLFKENSRISAEQYCNSISALALPSLNEVYLKKWFSFIRDNYISVII